MSIDGTIRDLGCNAEWISQRHSEPQKAFPLEMQQEAQLTW